jgi:hypothetical protein
VKEVSLARLDAHFGHEFPNGETVDVFGDDFASKFLRRLDDGPNDALLFGTGVEILYESPVNLDYVGPPTLFEP